MIGCPRVVEGIVIIILFLAIISSIVYRAPSFGFSLLFVNSFSGNQDLTSTATRASKGDRQLAVMPKEKGGV